MSDSGMVLRLITSGHRGGGGGGVRKALDATGPRVMLDFEFGGWGDGTFPRAIS